MTSAPLTSHPSARRQVDVRLLKEVIHGSIKQKLLLPSNGAADAKETPLPFQDIISGLGQQPQRPEQPKVQQQHQRDDSSAPFRDLSVHLCFICLLHLANENGLKLSNDGRLDSLSISAGGDSDSGRAR